MTDDEKTALANRLRTWAKEYAKLSGRAHAIAQMVEDMLAAADEIDPPA